MEITVTKPLFFIHVLSGSMGLVDMGNSIDSRILLLGIDGAGKTSFLNKFEHPNQEIPVEPTKAYNIHSIKVKGVKLSVWDISGKEATRSLWKHYYQEGSRPNAIIWVIDGASSEKSLEESKTCLNNALLDHSLANVILYVLVNKSDLDECKSSDDIYKFLDLESQKSKRDVIIHSISAVTGDGIKEAMDELAKGIRNSKANNEAPSYSNILSRIKFILKSLELDPDEYIC